MTILRHKAFTLVEILVAVVIVGTLGFAILQSIANNTKLIDYTYHKKSFIFASSIFALNMHDANHQNTMSFYELIQGKYLLDDVTRKSLEVKQFDLTHEDEEKVRIESYIDSNFDVDTNSTIHIKKYKINGEFGTYYYSLKSENL